MYKRDYLTYLDFGEALKKRVQARLKEAKREQASRKYWELRDKLLKRLDMQQPICENQRVDVTTKEKP